MRKDLEYPFDPEYILKKSKHIKKELLADGTSRIRKRIAVLGGSTTHDVIRILELFLLNQGIEPVFYESEYGQYWQDAMFGNEELDAFHPDIIYIHTSNRNITNWPAPGWDSTAADAALEEQFGHFQVMWEKIREKWNCPIIQNNMEDPFYRLLGNQDGVNPGGRTAFVRRMNERFAESLPDYSRKYVKYLQ